MGIKRNEGAADRIIRLLIGLALIGIGYFYLSGAAAIVLYVLGAISLITAATGFCALYKLLGASTLKAAKGGETKAPEQPPKQNPV